MHLVALVFVDVNNLGRFGLFVLVFLGLFFVAMLIIVSLFMEKRMIVVMIMVMMIWLF